MLIPILAVGAGVVLLASSRKASSRGSERPAGGSRSPTKLPADVEPPRPFRETPFAAGIARPLWPLLTGHQRGRTLSYRGDRSGKYFGNWARRFGAPRGNGARYHAGVDLFANPGDRVVAMADGEVVRVQRNFHLGASAVMVDHGDVSVLYGEVDARSVPELGIEAGVRVRAGQTIARVACMADFDDDGDCDSHMLHLETYTEANRNSPWYKSKGRPSNLRDPSLLLLRALHASPANA